MKPQVTINQQVAITALSFRSRNGLMGIPKRMEFNGKTYIFQNGLHYIIKKSGEVMRIFDMSDGTGTYRLKCDEQQRGWTLLAMPAQD